MTKRARRKGKQESGADFTTRLGELYLRAGRDPLDGLRFWSEVVAPLIDDEQASDDLVGSSFERLAEVVTALPDEAGDIAALVSTEREALEARRDRKRNRPIRTMARGFARGARRAFGATPPKPVLLSFWDLQDLLLLEEELKFSTSLECLQWLDLRLRAARDDRMRAHLAFAPLRLLPSDRLVEQLAGALAEGMDANLSVPNRMREALISHLALDRPVRDADDLEVDGAFWRLLANLSPDVITVADARSYLMRLWNLHSQETKSVFFVTTAVCEVVDRSEPASAAQSAFFRWLKQGGTCWAGSFAVLGMRALRREPGAAFHADRLLAMQIELYGEDMDAAVSDADRDLLEMMAAELQPTSRLGQGPEIVAALRRNGGVTRRTSIIYAQTTEPADFDEFEALKELVGS